MLDVRRKLHRYRREHPQTVGVLLVLVTALALGLLIVDEGA